MGHRALFQMDQAAFENQNIPWHVKKRRTDPDLGCDDILLDTFMDKVSDKIQRFFAHINSFVQRSVSPTRCHHRYSQPQTGKHSKSFPKSRPSTRPALEL